MYATTDRIAEIAIANRISLTRKESMKRGAWWRTPRYEAMNYFFLPEAGAFGFVI